MSVSKREAYNPEALLLELNGSPDWAEAVDAESLFPMRDCGDEPLVHELVFSMLLWESSMENTVRVMRKIYEEFVDYNELRVSFPHELEWLLGSRYQRASDRSERLIGALRSIFDRNQKLSLESLREMNKHEARSYLNGLGMLPKFVVSRLMLLGLSAHALPLDAKLARALHKAGLIKSAKNPDTIADEFERCIRATQTLETYTRLERWLVDYEKKS